MSINAAGKWKARKEAARIMLTEQKDKHKAAHNRAVTGVVYMDGCKPHPDTHPAILLMEQAHELDQMSTARHHEAMFAIYDKAIADLDKLPDESPQADVR